MQTMQSMREVELEAARLSVVPNRTPEETTRLRDLSRQLRAQEGL